MNAVIKPSTARKLAALNPEWEAIVFAAAAKIARGNGELQRELETSIIEAVEQSVTAAE